MGEMEDKIGAILNNPQMMQQIMSMAQTLGAQPADPQPPPAQTPSGLPQLDLGMLQKISGIAQQSSIDKREQALLGALGAYLSSDRVAKLEKAMRAAKLAKLASIALGQGAGQFLLGR